MPERLSYARSVAPRREDLGSWLEGTPGSPASDGGSRLGLPAEGPGSQASVLRRLVGLCIDWGVALAVAALLFPDPSSELPGILAADSTATLAVFAVSMILLVATLGSTIGHRVAGLRVVRLADVRTGTQRAALAGPGLVPALVRTVLLCLVIPAVIWDGDGRGMHDVAAGTVIVRR